MSGGLNEGDGHGSGEHRMNERRGAERQQDWRGVKEGGEEAEGQKRGIWIPEEVVAINGTGGAKEGPGIRNLGPWRGPGKSTNHAGFPEAWSPTLPVAKDTHSLAQCFVFSVRTGFSDLFIIF